MGSKKGMWAAGGLVVICITVLSATVGGSIEAMGSSRRGREIRKGSPLSASDAVTRLILAPQTGERPKGAWGAAPESKPALPAAQGGAGQDWLRGVSSGKTTVVDMTYAINANTPTWPGEDPAFSAKVVATPQKDGYFARSVSMPEHFGTHLDAPAHFPGGKLTLDQIPVNRLFAPIEVIDVRAEVTRNPDYRLTKDAIDRWEQAHARIAPGSFVILRTGWGSRVAVIAKYRNMDAKGVMHFPGYSVEAARTLIVRGVVGLGIDTLSIDYGPSKDFEVHRIDLPAGLYHLENLANTERLPETGAFLIAAPIKLEGGSGGPCRVFALLP